jgi:hypothetical protein
MLSLLFLYTIPSEENYNDEIVEGDKDTEVTSERE